MRIHRQKAEFHDRGHIAHPGRPERASRRSARHRTRSMRYLQALPSETSGCLTAMRLEGRDVGCGRMSPAMLMHRWSSTVYKELGVTAPSINEIVRRRRAVSAEMALRLSGYFGTSAQLWLNLQSRYDLEGAGRRIRKTLERSIHPISRPDLADPLRT